MLLGTQALLVVHLLHEMDLFLDWSHWTSIYDSPVRLSLWLVVKSTRNPPKIFIKPPSYPIDIPFTSHWLVYFPSEMSGAAAATHRASHIRSTRVGIPGSTGQEGGFWWDNLVALGQIFSGIDYQNYIHMLQYHRVSIYTPYINIYINICKYIYRYILYWWIDGWIAYVWAKTDQMVKKLPVAMTHFVQRLRTHQDDPSWRSTTQLAPLLGSWKTLQDSLV
jgi:hypothetical protein